MPRRQANDGGEITYGDLNKISSAIEKEFLDRIIFELVHRVENAFFQDSFLCEFVGPTTISVKEGYGLQTDNTVSDPEPTIRPLVRAATGNVTISTPHASLPRIDIIVVKHARYDDISESRKYKDASTGVVSNTTQVVQSDYEADVAVVAGVANVSPSAPATPSGYIKIAEIAVTATTGVADQDAITDTRSKLPSAEAMAEFLDLDIQGSDPAAPPADKMRLFFSSGVLYQIDENGVVNPVNQGTGIKIRRRVVAADSPVTVTSNDEIIEADLSAGSIVCNLPAAIDGKPYLFKIVALAGSNTLTVVRNSVQTSDQIEAVDGTMGTTLTLDELGQAESIFGNGTQAKWYRG